MIWNTKPVVAPVLLKKETEKAYLLTLPDGSNQFWLPKSQGSIQRTGHTVTASIKRYFAHGMDARIFHKLEPHPLTGMPRRRIQQNGSKVH